MSEQAFEQLLGDKLRAAGAYCYHPPDMRQNQQWKTADFIVCYYGRFLAVEAKEVQGLSFPLSRWSETQRHHARQVDEAGGMYFLVIRYMPSKSVHAVTASPQLWQATRGSLRMGTGMDLSDGRSFKVEPMFDASNSRGMLLSARGNVYYT